MTKSASAEGEPDIEALRAKYAEEREKRLRSDGDNQYVEVVDEFASYYEADPWSEPIERDPIVEDTEVVILGGGFAGLLAGSRVRQEGIEDFRIIEMGGDFGGTWYWNRYPGVQCDIESYCYMPLLDELDYVPRERYASGAEIYEHCQRIGTRFGLYQNALFQTMVNTVRWDENVSRWRLVTNRGDDIAAHYLIIALGPYNRPKLPGIPGIKDFKGHTFHTSRWDYEYTGGAEDGRLDRLGDKKIAVIGTGATGVQVIPKVAQYAEHVYVFQRTPSAVAPRDNAPTDQAWAANLPKGWARARRDNFNDMISRGLDDDQVGDYWTYINRQVVAQRDGLSADEVANLRLVEDFKLMERLRQRVDEVVDDPDTAETLKAWYRWNCKRPTFHDGYLDTFNRDNVTLIDVSETKGVERITENGIIAGDTEYEVDAILFASGFEITASDLRRRYGIDAIDGRSGVSLYDHWKDGYRTLHGFATQGFPNMFFIGQYQGGTSANVTSLYDDQALHVAYIIGEAIRRGLRTVEVSPEAEDAWVATMREQGVDRSEFYAECTPGYYNNEGGPMRFSHIGEVYAPGINAFNDLLRQWRERGDLDGYLCEGP